MITCQRKDNFIRHEAACAKKMEKKAKKPEDSFLCEQCDRKFSTKQNLQRHTATKKHTEPKQMGKPPKRLKPSMPDAPHNDLPTMVEIPAEQLKTSKFNFENAMECAMGIGLIDLCYRMNEPEPDEPEPSQSRNNTSSIQSNISTTPSEDISTYVPLSPQPSTSSNPVEVTMLTNEDDSTIQESELDEPLSPQPSTSNVTTPVAPPMKRQRYGSYVFGQQ
jgi:hypothetical protein